MKVPAGASKSIELGLDTGMTLYVSDGQELLKAIMRATASTSDGAVSRCKVDVTGNQQ